VSFLARLLAAIMALAVIAGGVLLWGYASFTGPGPLQSATTLVIAKGLGVDGVAARLADGGVLANPQLFALTVRLIGNGRALRAGEYLFPARASPRDVMTVLTVGKPVVRRLTVPEGLTTAQVVEQIDRTEGLEGAVATEAQEGGLLPETYDFSYGDGREEMLARMRKAMADTLAALWRGRAPELALTSPRQVVTLASIVEKETARPEERPHIAAVFLNRLAHRMRLQSDPTVAYALTQGKGALGRPLARADIETASPYNTYLHEGLPPGPIANPGKASIMAVLHPADSTDLYFVADGVGGHSFAKTLDEHNKNVAHLRQIEATPQAGKQGQ
jgi:UPF0755 protein